MHRSERGFTLVELSIVLVILGLLVGGVLTGQSLIRAAELRSVSTEFQRYQTAVHTFRDKYLALPGDMTNAQAYWGVSPDCSTVQAGTVTCNGNGNGEVGSMIDGTQFQEPFRMWQHLANAGLVEGNYTGVGSVTDYSRLNNPSGKIQNSIWVANNLGTLTGNPLVFDGSYGNIIAISNVNAGITGYAVLNAEDAYNIDMKMDDGQPAKGKVVVAGLLNVCTNTAVTSDLSATYLLTNKAINCALLFRNVF